LTYFGLAFAVIALLTLVNPTKFRVIIEVVLKPILDQSIDEPALRKHFKHSDVDKWVLSSWLLATIVTGSMLKSRLTATLVEPSHIHPPRTMWELVESQYKIGAFYYNETELGYIVEKLKNMKLIKKLRKKWTTYGVDVVDNVVEVNLA